MGTPNLHGSHPFVTAGIEYYDGMIVPISEK